MTAQGDWVAYREDEDGRTFYADGKWQDTRYIRQAERFETQGQAAECAASLTMQTRGREKWRAARFRAAVRW